MTHFYGQPIAMRCDPDGQPVHFTWRARAYPIQAILATWHLQDRWWAAAGPAAGTPRDAATASDRTYYRVRCVGELYAELYFDAAPGAWVLDRIYD